jgi:predicted permease
MATLLALGVLTLTMTVATITFAVVDATVLRPLPYGDSERLVNLAFSSPTAGVFAPPSPGDYLDWRDGAQTLTDIAAERTNGPLWLEVDRTSENVMIRRVTPNLFDVLQVHAAMGRLFGDGDTTAPVAVVGHDFWVNHLGADPSVVGRHVTLDHQPVTIIGVLPEGIAYPIARNADELYVPYVPPARGTRASTLCCLSVVARLRPGVTVDQAQADMERISSSTVVRSLRDSAIGASKVWLLFLLAAVAVVVVVASVNVSGLMFARSVTRLPELAIREALGASRRRLAFVLLIEGVIVAVAAALVALVPSLWGVAIAKTTLPPDVRRAADVVIGGRVFVTTLCAGAICGLFAAGAPAWLAVRHGAARLTRPATVASHERGRRRVLSGLLTIDVAFVSTPLVAASLIVTSFVIITTMDLGFDRQHVMVAEALKQLTDVPPAARSSTAATIRQEMMARAKATPGVADAAMLFGVGPLSRSQMGRLVSIPGVHEDQAALVKSITPNYFSVMGMRAIRGRLFRPSDESGPPVSIISDAAAREFFPGRDPLGQTIVIEPHRERVLTVVIGIVRGLPISSPEEVPSAELYMLIAQDPSRHDTRMTVLGETLVVRTAGDPHIVERQVVSAIQPVLGDATIHTHVLEDFFRDTTIDRRFASSVLGAVGLLALVIGAIGIYGTVAFLVARQARSIGVRLALGASRGWILRWTLAWALRPVGLGVVLGLVGAWAMSSTFTALLFRVQPADPRVYSAVAMFLLLVGVTAGLVPALRAARIDPIAVLRQE